MIADLFRRLFYIEQWSVGVAEAAVADFLNEPDSVAFDWIVPKRNTVFVADPFALEDDGGLTIFCERYDHWESCGEIIALKQSDNFSEERRETLLKSKTHYSYPFVWQSNDRIWIIPEQAEQGCLNAYKLENNTLTQDHLLVDEGIIDATLFQHDGMTWLFGTKKAKTYHQDKDLLLYFSETARGPYKPHPLNPIRSGLRGTRPAGGIIKCNNQIFRPSQDSSEEYGGAIVLHEILEISPTSYREREVRTISPNMINGFDSGIHTINATKNHIVVDSKRWILHPFTPLLKLLSRLRSSRVRNRGAAI